MSSQERIDTLPLPSRSQFKAVSDRATDIPSVKTRRNQPQPPTEKPVSRPQRQGPERESSPLVLETVALRDIDAGDTTFQFRFKSDSRPIRDSLAAKGQLNPIKLIAGKQTYRIVDGHTRVNEAKSLGWTTIRALLYEGMSDDDAKALSYEANVTRRNLSFGEKANAMQLALNGGLSRNSVAKLFGVTPRTVNRYLELPEELRAHIDCKSVTMAHGRILRPLVGMVPREALEKVILWIRETGATEKQLRGELKRTGLADRRGGKQTFGIARSGSVRGYPFQIGPLSTAQARRDAIGFFKQAILKIEEMAHGDSGASESQF